MTSSVLHHEQFNAIVIGNGAIGSALVGSLLKRDELRSLVILQRGSGNIFDDPRVTTLRFDAEDSESLVSAAKQVKTHLTQVHLMINTVGVLHDKHQQPEKSLRSFESENLQRAFLVNAGLLPSLAKALGGLLRHEDPALFVSLSARVGSIQDNRLGGWYSYRASKAAHNMLLRTIAQEWRVSHQNAAIVALHPGTVHSPLSEPYITQRYKNPVRTPVECAESLLDVIENLPKECSGNFYDWRGDPVAW